MLNLACFVLSAALAAESVDLTPNPVALRRDGLQSDFASLAVDSAGTPWVAYVEWDGQIDVLRLAKRTDAGLEAVTALGTPGIIHQPALVATIDGLVVVWSQVNEQNLMELKAQVVRDGRADGDVVTLASSPNGGNVFPRAAADKAGNVWVVWQGNRGTHGDVFCRTFDSAAKKWGQEVRVTDDAMGDWEPCVAFAGEADGAWVIYDSSRGNEFNIYANRVGLDGTVGATKTLVKTDRYEGRVAAVGMPDGRGIWLSFERGNQQWGLDTRAHGGPRGLNGRKDSVLAYWDLASDKVEEAPTVDHLLDALPGPPTADEKPAAAAPRTNKPAAKAVAAQRAEARAAEEKAAAAKKPAPAKQANSAIVSAVNLPQVMLDAQGRPWVTVRYFKNYCWRLALTRYDPQTKQWTEPVALPDSQYSQDRRASSALAADGTLWLCWLSDLRTSKLQRFSGFSLAKVAVDAELERVAPQPNLAVGAFRPYINPETPERPRADRHSFTHDGVTYHLYWGDYHRHTDVSNCITANDGCVVEQFRYAYDMAKLDTLGTSDHTDVGKIYTPYEWWLNQKLVDVFYAPGFFNSMYAYEREQRWPHGHRNIVFAQRGGPIVYIQRENYLASPWQKIFPVATEGEKELSPTELYTVLTRYAKPVTAISHTGATRMGTDWNLAAPVDHRVENVVEIFQGARVSYEGRGAPQPTVGLREGEKYNPAATVAGNPLPGDPIQSFTEYDNGLYQNALGLGFKLGVWANSDHISQHTSFGGVYVKDFTREGIIEGLNARRTIAATDKIFVDFTCNGHLLGTEIELAGKPYLSFSVDGTADLKRVTLVRNEQNYKQWEPGTRTFTETFEDGEPLKGENRYYLRVEQADGNMAWSSPVWVQVK